MKKGFLFLLVFVAMFVAVDVFAQGCPMCKTSLEEARKNGSQVGNTINNGILYLLALPYLIVGTFGALWYRNLKARKKNTPTA
jgi:hypothetical protein